MIRVNILLKRNPVTLTPLTPFETAYRQYRDALQLKGAAAAVKQFSHEHFFKKGSILQQRWSQLHSSQIPHSSLSSPMPTSKSVDDELTAAIAEIQEATTRLAQSDPDTTSLDRKLSHPLFLVLKPANSSNWVLPGTPGTIKENELLHEAAMRGIVESCGAQMELWGVGRVPVGHVVEKNVKTFIMKQVILSGRVVLNSAVASEHAWLTKEEMEGVMEKEYFEGIRDII
ncbi:hypothetical protein BC830DRAFT_1137787 [Chytriomyces sp. MP71]|nr:hypothetical protein BC830DRAFT_1137787 [Chytriomyces sp. MP71]